jgi:hypothetical protein
MLTAILTDAREASKVAPEEKWSLFLGFGFWAFGFGFCRLPFNDHRTGVPLPKKNQGPKT